MTNVGRRVVGVLTAAVASLALWAGVALAGGASAAEPSDSSTAVVQRGPGDARGFFVQTQEENSTPGEQGSDHNCPRDRTEEASRETEETSV